MNADDERLLLELPERVETPRLVLRPPRPGDGPMTAASVRASLAELAVWMPWAHDGYDDRDGEAWCRRGAANWLLRKQFQFVILAADDGRHLGNVGAFDLDWDVRACEVGYWLRTDHTGRGLMTEAVVGVVGFLRRHVGMNRIVICCDDGNVRSARVAERAGFAFEGTHRGDCRYPSGRVRDSRIYASLPKE